MSASVEFAKRYLSGLGGLIERLDTHAIGAFVQTLLDARARGACIYFVGNGGSAATASHFANDLSIGVKASAPPFRALSLTDNVAVLTALGNDYGYDQVFVRQLEVHWSPGDVLVAISVSGNSPNIVRAAEYANGHAGLTVALTGFDGGRLKSLAHVSIHVENQKGEYGPVEDIHMVIDHLVSAYLNAHRESEP